MANGKRVAGVSVDMTLELAQFKQSCREAEGVTRQMTAQMREEMEHSRESVRLLSEELHLGIPRGLQGIISKLPGITTAMNAAFDAVIVFALAKTIYEVGEKIVEMVRKSEEAAAKHREMYNGLITSMEHTNDSLTVQSDGLQRSIDKIEHKPHNGIKDAIDEAIEGSDKLGEKLDDNIKKIAAGLAGEAPGKLDWLMGATYDKGPQAVIDKLKKSMEEIELGKSLLPGNKDEQRRNALFVAKTEAESNSAKVQPDQWTDPAIAEANAAKERGQYQTIAAGMSESMTTADLMKKIAGQTSTLHSDEDNKAAMTAADEATKKAWDDQLKTLDAQGNDFGLAHKKSNQEEYEFWEQKASTVTKGSELYRVATDHANESRAGYGADQFNANLKYLAEQLRKTEEAAPRGPDETYMVGVKADAETTEAQKKAARQIFEGYSEDLEQKEQLQELLIKIEQANGRLTASQAASQLMALHGTTRAAEQQAFGAAQNSGAVYDLKESGKYTPQAGLDQQIQDQQVLFKLSFQSSVDETFDSIIAKSQDWGTQFKSTIEGALGDVNNAILHVLTTKPQAGDHPFKEAGKAIFTGVAKTGLDDAEGAFFKAGKLGASEASAMWVRLTGGKGGAVSTGAGMSLQQMLALANPGSTAEGGPRTSGILPGVLSLAPMLGLAGGGVLSPGDFYMTGEQGPELMQVGSTSKINNARDTASIMSGSGGSVTNHSWSIDARGATDPAAVYQAAQRAIYAAAPHLVSATHQMQTDDARRRPSR